MKTKIYCTIFTSLLCVSSMAVAVAVVGVPMCLATGDKEDWEKIEQDGQIKEARWQGAGGGAAS